jgi:hypothetical protein
MSNIPEDTTSRVELGPVVGLPDMPEMPRDVARRVAGLSKHEWTDDDWIDVLRAQRIVAHNVAVRHGLLKQPNDQGEPGR